MSTTLTQRMNEQSAVIDTGRPNIPSIRVRTNLMVDDGDRWPQLAEVYIEMTENGEIEFNTDIKYGGNRKESLSGFKSDGEVTRRAFRFIGTQDFEALRQEHSPDQGILNMGPVRGLIEELPPEEASNIIKTKLQVLKHARALLTDVSLTAPTLTTPSNDEHTP